jgi:signal transduction protein with GAF and PtsI domain
LAKLARSTHDSRIKKRANGAIEAIRAAQGAIKEVKELRDDYDKLKEDYEKLRERLDKIDDLGKEKKKSVNLKKTQKLAKKPPKRTTTKKR